MMKEKENMNPEVEYRIDDDIYAMFREEPFFAALSRQLNKVPNKSIKTAGIFFNEKVGMFEINYNPDFMMGKTEGCPIDGFKDRKWVLMHELYHASLGHCTYRKFDHVSRKMANVAMDLAINSLDTMRRDAPKWVLMPGRGTFENIKQMAQATQWYIAAIQKDMEKNPDKYGDDGEGGESGEGQPGEGGAGQPGEGDGLGGVAQFDDHSDFGNSDNRPEGEDDSEGEAAARDIAEQQIADAVANASQECDVGDGSEMGRAKGWGSVSRSMQDDIRKYAATTKTQLNPKKIFASFVKRSQAASRRTSVTKRSRRLPGKKFGKRTAHVANIAISVDQSGSVSNHLLARAFGFMNELSKFATFTLIPFDDRVFEEKVYVWKKGENRKWERVLCGGTDFNAPTKYVNERNFDGHIVITDMCAPSPVRSNCQRMWVTDESGKNSSWCETKGEKVLVL